MSESLSLVRELDAWADAGRVATLWWRDDDAPADFRSLERLLSLSRKHRVSCGLAIVPSRDIGALARQLDGDRSWWAMQHGFSHACHSSPPDPPSELGLDRPVESIIAELRRGFERMQQIFGARFLPILVPPYNRIAPALIPLLPKIGLRGLSVAGSTAAPAPTPGFLRINVHCNPVAWGESQSSWFSGPSAWGEIVDHLRRRRLGSNHPGEATGLMTHHWAHDEETWEFCDELLSLVNAHPAARWLSEEDLTPGTAGTPESG